MNSPAVSTNECNVVLTEDDDKAPHASDPQMHQTKKGNQYYFGIKAHIGVDD